MAIARSQGQDHLLAISGRDSLSPPVTDIIVERGDAQVVTRVAANHGAKFSDAGFQQLTKRAAKEEDVLSALTSRRDIPQSLIGEIKQAVTERLSREMAHSHPDVVPEELARMVAEKTASIDLEAFQASNERLQRMKYAGQDIGTHVERLRACAAPARDHALSGAAHRARRRAVSHCLLKAHLCALGVLCKANGFGTSTYAALIQIRAASNPMRGNVIAAAMCGYDPCRVIRRSAC